MLLQYVLVVLLLLTSSFKIVLVSSQFTLICCQIMTVFGVSVLRKKQAAAPDASQEIFRCPLYPLPSIVFIGVSLLALGYTAMTNPLESSIGIGVILFGLALHPLFRRG